MKCFLLCFSPPVLLEKATVKGAKEVLSEEFNTTSFILKFMVGDMVGYIKNQHMEYLGEEATQSWDACSSQMELKLSL